jgi:hypothetical protein
MADSDFRIPRPMSLPEAVAHYNKWDNTGPAVSVTDVREANQDHLLPKQLKDECLTPAPQGTKPKISCLISSTRQRIRLPQEEAPARETPWNVALVDGLDRADPAPSLTNVFKPDPAPALARNAQRFADRPPVKSTPTPPVEVRAPRPSYNPEDDPNIPETPEADHAYGDSPPPVLTDAEPLAAHPAKPPAAPHPSLAQLARELEGPQREQARTPVAQDPHERGDRPQQFYVARTTTREQLVSAINRRYGTRFTLQDFIAANREGVRVSGAQLKGELPFIRGQRVNIPWTQSETPNALAQLIDGLDTEPAAPHRATPPEPKPPRSAPSAEEYRLTGAVDKAPSETEQAPPAETDVQPAPATPAPVEATKPEPEPTEPKPEAPPERPPITVDLDALF